MIPTYSWKVAFVVFCPFTPPPPVVKSPSSVRATVTRKDPDQWSVRLNTSSPDTLPTSKNENKRVLDGHSPSNVSTPESENDTV
eukprot:3103538-Rhodomonas_salina.1